MPRTHEKILTSPCMSVRRDPLPRSGRQLSTSQAELDASHWRLWRHDVAYMSEIEGEMPMLISVWQLAAWGSRMDVRANVHSFDRLDVHDIALPRSSGGHFLRDLCHYGEDPASDPLFAEFLIEPQEQALLANAEDMQEKFVVRDEAEAYWNSVESAIEKGQ